MYIYIYISRERERETLTSSNNKYVIHYPGGYYRGSALSVRKPVALRAPQGLTASETMFHMRNLLGWLRLGWLKIGLVILN